MASPLSIEAAGYNIRPFDRGPLDVINIVRSAMDILKISEDDQWSEFPGRRRMYWMYDAAGQLENHYFRVKDGLTELPAACRAALHTGMIHTGEDIEFYFEKVREEMHPKFREGISNLLSGIKAIVHEKGYRFGSSLSTASEHARVHSSGFGKYAEIDPDIPIAVLDRQLAGKGLVKLRNRPGYTIEEADRARRLIGETRLNPDTGRVTNQVDEEAAANSYIFLSEERSAEVKREEEQIMRQIKTIAVAARAEFMQNVLILYDLHAISRGEITFPQFQGKYSMVLGVNLADHIRELRRIAYETGMWDRILTPQEILLRKGADVDKKYLERPYTPIAIQDGGSIEEISNLRRGEKSMGVNTEILGYERSLGFRLEELNESGNTVKRPTILDYDSGVDRDEETRQYVTAFPFPRPED